jgi:thymidylate synthase (FAD)
MEKSRIMTVKLISYTQPSKEFFEETGMSSLDDLIAYTARVSNPSNQMNKETSSKLITYLAKHKHWSPFEMVNVVLEITSTRDIVRQILRHRSFSFQEFSQRYADPTKDMNFITREARLQDKKNRQNSIELDEDEIQLITDWNEYQIEVSQKAVEAYNFAIEKGIAKEVARSVLPEGMTESKIYMNGTLRSWIHYLKIRLEKGTQKEHRDIADDCAQQILEVFPSLSNFIVE